MLRSLLTGVSGAIAHQKKLDVVGNNIANVNTVGYKKSTVAFQDLLSQTDRGAMAPDGNRGGVNPRQVGLGVRVGAIQTIHTQGPLSYTGNRTDMAIQGEGYFVVNAGKEQYYTRAGNFVLDGNSDLVTSGNGYRVQGNQIVYDEEGLPTWGTDLSDINIPMGQKIPAKETSVVGYRCNLDSRVDPYLPMGVPEGVMMTTTIDGVKHTVEVFEGDEASDFITVRLTNDTDGSVETFKMEFDGVQQSDADEGVYYPKLKSGDDRVKYNASRGELEIKGVTVPMGAYTNYQAITVQDSTGINHTYLAEVTEIDDVCRVRLWGQGKNEVTGEPQKDYFEWSVPRTKDGLFDFSADVKMRTGNDSNFPDEASIAMSVGSSGKTLNFRGIANPIIAPTLANSGVSRYGDTSVSMKVSESKLDEFNLLTGSLGFTPYSDSGTREIPDPLNPGGTIPNDYSMDLNIEMPKGPFSVGDVVPMTVTSSYESDGVNKTNVDTIRLKYVGVNDADKPIFLWQNDGGDWVGFGASSPTARVWTLDSKDPGGSWSLQDMAVGYDEGETKFDLTHPGGDVPASTEDIFKDSIKYNRTISEPFSSKVDGPSSLKSFEVSIETGVPSSVHVGQEFDLKLKTVRTEIDPDNGSESIETSNGQVRARCVEMDSETGLAVLEWFNVDTLAWVSFADADPKVSLKHNNGVTWVDADYTLSYSGGDFKLSEPADSPYPDAPPVAGTTLRPFPAAFSSVSGDRSVTTPVGFYFKEGDTVDSFMSMMLNYPNSGGLAGATETVNLAFKGVSDKGEVILEPSPATVQLPVPDPDNPDKMMLAPHTVVYDQENNRISVVNEATGKSSWDYNDFNLQTTDINGRKYVIDYDSSRDPSSTYGDVINLWGPDETGEMGLFTINATTPAPEPPVPGTLGYTNDGGKITYSGSGSFDRPLTGGVKVTVSPSASDPSRLMFSYDGVEGGVPVGTIKENSTSVHDGKGVVYDSLGNPHALDVTWKKVGNNVWSWEASLPDDPDIAITNNKGVLRFSSEGELITDGDSTLSIGFSAIGANDSEILLDFSGESFGKEGIDGVTQFGSDFTTKPYTQNGYRMGVMNDFYVTESGTIVGSYDNGHIQELYKVSLAMFSNPQGLTKVGDTAFARTINSGEPNIVNSMVEGAGTIAGSTTESSNVEITEEFTQMILAQRGYQSNARVITTSDAVLEEAINLKR